MNTKVHIHLLRGLTRESGHWGNFIEILQKQLPDAKIHLLDLPGSGRFAHKKSPWKISEMVDFMRRDFLRTYEPGEHIICATSLGGMVATEWVMNYKSDFQGLILICSSFRKICKSAERAQKSVRGDMVRILFARSFQKRESLIVRVNSNKPETHRTLVNEWVAIQKKRPMSQRNIFRQTMAGLRYAANERKPDLPLLIFGSKGDRMVCTSCIEKTHQAFGGTLIWHPDSGHSIPLDEPQWLGEQMTKWITTRFREEREKLLA